MTSVDEQWLARALQIAERGRSGARPNPIVGAVLARGDELLAQGYHARYGDRHAERVALDAHPDPIPTDATLYVTLEPCAHTGQQPPCADLLLERGVRRVVVGCADPSEKTSGIGPRRLREHGVQVIWAEGALRSAAMNANAGFLSSHLRGRPWVRYKYAMTSDGKLATGDPQRRWVSGEQSRYRAHLLRAGSGAVMIGVDTALADNPQLTVRGTAAMGMLTAPLRVVLDRQARLPLASQLVATAREVPTIVVVSEPADSAAVDRLRAYGVDVWTAPDADALGWTMRNLTERGVNDVLLESGPTLAQAAFETGLIDELIAFVAPAPSVGEAPGFAPDSPFRSALDRAEPEQSGEDLMYRIRVTDASSWS